MDGISKFLKRFISHKNKVDGSLIMAGEIWNPKSKQQPAFAVAYVSQRPVVAALP